jgi:hypothetical protein
VTSTVGSTSGVPRQRRRLSALLRNILIGVVALLIGVLGAELLLRLLDISYPVYVWTHPVRGLAHIPGAEGGPKVNGGRWVEINSDGWRGPDVPLEHPRNTFRIALLGDSFIEAFEVPFQETAGEVLERRLSSLWNTPVEVLNFGHGGYGTGQQLLTLQHEVCGTGHEFRGGERLPRPRAMDAKNAGSSSALSPGSAG